VFSSTRYVLFHVSLTGRLPLFLSLTMTIWFTTPLMVDAPTVGTLRSEPHVVYTIEDSFYKQSRFFKIDTSTFPYSLTNEYRLTDPDGLLIAIDRTSNFTLRNNDTTVNLDLEGIAKSASGGFWLVSEGGAPTESPNLLLKVDDAGVITQVVTLPSAVAALQVRRFVRRRKPQKK
jgi:hypothetical protein